MQNHIIKNTQRLACILLICTEPATATNSSSPGETAAVPPHAQQSDAGSGNLIDPIILLPVEGDPYLVTQIAEYQKWLEGPISHRTATALQNLGWLFVAKARRDSDPGNYSLAMRCADELSLQPGKEHETLLLRGYVHHQLHQFSSAEPIARKLAAERGRPFDYGLLGDILLDRGEISAAAEAYQHMMDLRPGLEAYIRAGEIRYLRGDLEGSLEAMRLAVRSGSPRNPEPVAWALSRLALLELQAGDTSSAMESASHALTLVPEYVPALVASGRISMASDDLETALASLAAAAAILPQPAQQWAHWECLTALNRYDEAHEVSERLTSHGRREDPRTLALFLASTGIEVPEAISLARRELDVRQDVFTHDALAWALAASGDLDLARREITLALSEGTDDARLHYHAGIIAQKTGLEKEALEHLRRADRFQQTLYPSERMKLRQALSVSETEFRHENDK